MNISAEQLTELLEHEDQWDVGGTNLDTKKLKELEQGFATAGDPRPIFDLVIDAYNNLFCDGLSYTCYPEKQVVQGVLAYLQKFAPTTEVEFERYT